MDKSLAEVLEELEHLARECQFYASMQDLFDPVFPGFSGDEDLEQRLEALLQLSRSLRDAGALDLAGNPRHFFFVAFPIMSLAALEIWEDKSDSRLLSLGQRMQELKEESGLAFDESWPEGRQPEEWEGLRNRYDRLCDESVALAFAEQGEVALGELFLRDKKAFLGQYDAGCRMDQI